MVYYYKQYIVKSVKEKIIAKSYINLSRGGLSKLFLSYKPFLKSLHSNISIRILNF